MQIYAFFIRKANFYDQLHCNIGQTPSDLFSFTRLKAFLDAPPLTINNTLPYNIHVANVA